MPLVMYSVYRIALFFVAVVVLYFLGLGGWLVWVWGAVLALLMSYAMLGRQRDRASLYLAGRKARRASGHRFSEREEVDFDEEDEAIERASAGAESGVMDESSGEPDEKG